MREVGEVAEAKRPDEPQKHKVRTVMRPYEEIEVEEAELLDLQRQGLVSDETKGK